MTDPTDRFRELLETISRGELPKGWEQSARKVLEVLAESQPEPAWQPGDVMLWKGRAFLRSRDGVWIDASAEWDGDFDDSDNAELIARAGRRVHPPRFANHAEALRTFAQDICNARELGTGLSKNIPDALRRIALDLAGDSDD